MTMIAKQKTSCDDYARISFNHVGVIKWISRWEMRNPVAYQWLIICSFLDFILTGLVIGLGGVELNPLAAGVIVFGGFSALLAYKMSLLVFVVILCEYITLRRVCLGRNLSRTVAIMWALPPALSICQLIIVGCMT